MTSKATDDPESIAAEPPAATDLGAPVSVKRRNVSSEQPPPRKFSGEVRVGRAPGHLAGGRSAELDETSRFDEVLDRPGRSLERADTTPVSTIMTSRGAYLRATMALESLEYLLVSRGVSQVPVVDSRGKPIGIVSSADVVRQRREDADATTPSATAVADIMVPMTVCLSAKESIARAAALMVGEGVHLLPLVGPSGAVVGVVSALDILRWLARAHGYSVSRRD